MQSLKTRIYSAHHNRTQSPYPFRSLKVDKCIYNPSEYKVVSHLATSSYSVYTHRDEDNNNNNTNTAAHTTV